MTEIIKCPDCKGGGYILQVWYNILFGFREIRSSLPCPRCNGLGVLKVSIDDIEKVNNE